MQVCDLLFAPHKRFQLLRQIVAWRRRRRAAAAQARRNLLGGKRRLDAKLFLQDRATPGVLFQRGLGLSLGSQGLHQVAVRRFQPRHKGQLPAGGAGQIRPLPLLCVTQLESRKRCHQLFVQLLADDQLPIVELDSVAQTETGEKFARVEIGGCRQLVDSPGLGLSWQRSVVRQTCPPAMNVDGACALCRRRALRVISSAGCAPSTFLRLASSLRR